MSDAPAWETIADTRDHFLPIRKSELLDALLEDSSLVAPADRVRVGDVNRLLAAIFHFEYFARLDALRDAYYAVDPEYIGDARVSADVFARNYRAFADTFVALLKGANFVEITPEEIGRSYETQSAVRFEVDTPIGDFHEFRFFRRGQRLETLERRSWYGLKKREIDIAVYENVVLLAAVKPYARLEDEKQAERLERMNMVPASVIIKCFRNIASADINMLLPNVRIRMSWLDRLVLGVPALVGGVPIVLKLVSSLTVLFVVIGFYLGLSASVGDEDIKTALAALGALVALGGFFIRQWVRYERQSLRYLRQITENFFFRSINHNAGFFDYILATAEDQDHKEALLAYLFARRLGAATGDDLRIAIENWAKARFPVVMRLEVADAVAKLQRLGLASVSGGKIVCVDLDEAARRLASVWRQFFPASAPAVIDGV